MKPHLKIIGSGIFAAAVAWPVVGAAQAAKSSPTAPAYVAPVDPDGISYRNEVGTSYSDGVVVWSQPYAGRYVFGKPELLPARPDVRLVIGKPQRAASDYEFLADEEADALWRLRESMAEAADARASTEHAPAHIPRTPSKLRRTAHHRPVKPVTKSTVVCASEPTPATGATASKQGAAPQPTATASNPRTPASSARSAADSAGPGPLSSTSQKGENRGR